MPLSREEVEAFLRVPVPPSARNGSAATQLWHDWQARARQVGTEHAGVLLDALENAAEAEQHAALLVLRLLGYEAWGDGYGPDLVYKVTAPEPGAQKRIIRPKVTPTPEH